ncbi:hypothetical protein [Gilvimarinus sp. 1_MG-2023]|uniref:hypothetical protein n=1 Tax=Gilvimarinus sp. 1_MG-2023 TaxID=3062638 RepID=UPI0026E33BEA|nr:hypothetical protein [Gilvimarinus sp. 1_MG-2023]MDO6746805.1 hypothetical protein [Gilvimarinus sp. 1_MG-2023]
MKLPASYTTERQKLALLLVIAAFACAAVWFRLWQLPLQLIADDEWHALHKLTASDAWGIFTSFGHADHSIPVTLYYYGISLFTPLTEGILRAPMVAVGLATPIVIPLLCGRFLSRQEQILLFLLLALSPILIYYTRTARPYAISTFLTGIAVIVFYLWTIRPSVGKAVVYLLCCSLSAWMQPVTLTFLLTPFLFYGIKSLYLWGKRGHHRLFWLLLALGLSQLAALALLLGPPIYYNIHEITGKTGSDSPTVTSLIDTFRLLLGSASNFYGALALAATIFGVYTLWQRNREVTLYIGLCIALPFIVIANSGAAWIQHPLVSARYGLPALLFLGIFLATGIAQATRIMHRQLFTPLVVATAAAIYFAGPLPRIYAPDINQFTNHMVYQADYRWEENYYNVELDNRPISEFYQTLGSGKPKEVNIVIAPWFLEWHWDRWYIDQAVHQQQITAGFLDGFCGSRFYGEYPPENQQIALKNIVHISALATKSHHSKHDYLIYHKNASRGDRDAARYRECGQKVREMFGPPTYEDDVLVAYPLNHTVGL